MKKSRTQYTIRNVPPPLDAALRERARRQGRSLNAVALEALRSSAGVSAAVRYADLDAFFGSWVKDKAVDQALADQRQVDEGLWR